MDFNKARDEFRQLAKKYRQGRITSDAFADAVDDLAVTDDEGKEWKIGLQSGNWYRKEGEEWVEDTPTEEQDEPIATRSEETAAEKRVRRIIFVMVMTALAAAICLMSLYFANGGALFSTDIFGDTGGANGNLAEHGGGDGDAASGEDGQGEEGEGGSGDAGFDPTQTNELDSGDQQPTQGQDDSPPEQTSQPTALPSATYTATPPAPEVPPQVWRTLNDTLLNNINNFTGEWDDVPDKDWEYEVLSYQDQEALFLQFDVPEELLYSGGQSVDDVERSLTLALPDEDGRVSMLCRWQNNRGYALSLSNQRWALLKVEGGSQDVLAEGPQPDGFRQGGYAAFRLRCVGQQISAWKGDEVLASVVDGSFSSGTTGLRFDAPGGIALAYIARDLLRVHVAGQDTAGLSDSVRMGLLEVTVPRGVQEYPAMQEADYAGQPLVGVRVRFSNQEGDKAVYLGGQNFYLTNGERRVYALAFVPQSAGEVQVLALPQTVQAGDTSTGEVFFPGISAAQLDGWQLVIDLRYQALGEARFAVE